MEKILLSSPHMSAEGYEQEFSLEDKKYLSLYLGVLNTENSITNYLKSKNINIKTFINFNILSQEEYLKIYNNYFIGILDEINYKYIEDYMRYLLSKKAVKIFNRDNKFFMDHIISEKNKRLVKVIK